MSNPDIETPEDIAVRTWQKYFGDYAFVTRDGREPLIARRFVADLKEEIDRYYEAKIAEADRAARIDERKMTISEWNAASAKYGSLYSKRLYAIAKSGEKRLAELSQPRNQEGGDDE